MKAMITGTRKESISFYYVQNRSINAENLNLLIERNRYSRRRLLRFLHFHFYHLRPRRLPRARHRDEFRNRIPRHQHRQALSSILLQILFQQKSKFVVSIPGNWKKKKPIERSKSEITGEVREDLVGDDRRCRSWSRAWEEERRRDLSLSQW